jgi:hypothetical protein
MDHEIALRVAARYQRTVLATQWEGKLVGKDFRVQWARDYWLLEELPQKGKKKLRVDTMDGGGSRWSGSGSVNVSAYLYQNILRVAKPTPSDSFDHVKQKIQSAMDAAADEVIAANPGGKWDFLKHTKWDEKLVYFTEVMPEGMEPFTVEGNDFSVQVEWTSFKAYSPDSDFQQADPSYSVYNESSPSAARKLYQLLKENPSAIKHIPWDKFSDWLNQNKIGYKTHFSQWR